MTAVDKISLTSDNQSASSSPMDSIVKVLNIFTCLLVIVSVIIGSVTYSELQDCVNDSSTTCTATFSEVSSVTAALPTCDATCPGVNYHHLLPQRYYLYQYLLGPMRLVQSDLSGEDTLFSEHLGAVNDLQQVLCNYTAATSNTTATVFQYDSTNTEFTRVVTTVPKAEGGYAVCTTLDKTSLAYQSLMAGESYYGDAHLFGVDYETIYAPIFDYVTNRLIGCLYIGSPVD